MPEQAEIQDGWTDIAPAFDETVTPSNIAIAEEAIRLVGLRPEMRMLDVAAGSGALSIPAARTGAEVIATDISPAMVEHLDQRARAEGFSNIEARVMDGHDLEFEDGSFDVVGSQFGVMLFPDLPRGLREMARVTRPGGRVVVVTMGLPTEVEFLGFFLEGVKSTVPGFDGLPMDPPPLPFQVSDPERLYATLTGAGLSDIRIERANHRLEFETGAQLWDWVTASNPIGAELVADLTPTQERAVKDALDAALRERAGVGETAVLNNPVNIGIGTR